MILRFYFLVFIGVGLVSCENNSKVEEQGNLNVKQEQNEDNTETEDSTINSDETEESEVDPGFFVEPFHLEDFPKKWIQLEEHDSLEDRIIYDYCMREIAQVFFGKQNGDSWIVYAGYGHDGNEWEVVNFEAMKQTRGDVSVVNGSFNGYSKADTIVVDFYWNIEEKYCTFKGFNYTIPYFVSDKNKDHYQLVKENCDEIHH